MMGMAPARCLCKLLDLTSGQNTLQGDRKSTQRSRNRSGAQAGCGQASGSGQPDQ